jgi:hypothetical protein
MDFAPLAQLGVSGGVSSISCITIRQLREKMIAFSRSYLTMCAPLAQLGFSGGGLAVSVA